MDVIDTLDATHQVIRRVQLDHRSVKRRHHPDDHPPEHAGDDNDLKPVSAYVRENAGRVHSDKKSQPTGVPETRRQPRRNRCSSYETEPENGIDPTEGLYLDFEDVAEKERLQSAEGAKQQPDG